MSYALLPSVLGATFFAIWFFIAVTQLRDKLLEARNKRLEDGQCAAAGPHYARRRRSRRNRQERAVAGT